jgi:glycosyltransferase involved in cell wall biosynthesis
MLIQALLPDIHQHPTGGNLFNRQMLAFLEGVATVERRVMTNGASLPVKRAGVTLVDSLLLAPAGDYLRDAPGPHVLVAHYLHLFEPGRRDSPEAQRERLFLSRVDAVITTSEYCREVLLEEGFAPQQLAVVTPGLAPGYALEVTPRAPAAARILTVSSILPGKGLRQLLEGLETLADLDWTWELAGDPELDREFSADFHRRVERSSVAERIRLHGAVDPDRMVGLYDDCHLFVLPSRFETCSMATMEAMARGLPVVAYRVGGLPERLPEATAQRLAPPGDRQRLGVNLRFLLEDSGLATRLGATNRQASRTFPTWQQSGQRMWEFLRAIENQAKPGLS